jgi:hypothetical protein
VKPAGESTAHRNPVLKSQAAILSSHPHFAQIPNPSPTLKPVGGSSTGAAAFRALRVKSQKAENVKMAPIDRFAPRKICSLFVERQDTPPSALVVDEKRCLTPNPDEVLQTLHFCNFEATASAPCPLRLEVCSPMEVQHVEAEHKQATRPQWWPKGVSGNPSGVRVSTHALALYREIGAELGGLDSLSAIDRALLLQACRLLVRSLRLKDHDTAIRMSSKARRTLEGLRRRAAVPAATSESFTDIAARAQSEAETRRAAELAADAASEQQDAIGTSRAPSSTSG